MSSFVCSQARLGAVAGLGILFACLAPAPAAQADNVTHVANVALATAYPFSYIDKAEGQADSYCAASGGVVAGGGTYHYPSIQLLDFGFDIPFGAAITTITVSAKTATPGEDRSQGAKVRLLWGDSSNGGWYVMSVKGSGSSNSVSCEQTAFSAVTRSDWGHSFTRAEVNDTAFGVELMATANGNTVMLDSMKVTVEYEFPDRIFANGFDAP